MLQDRDSISTILCLHMYDRLLRYSEKLLANLTVLNMLKRRTCDRREDALPRNVVTPSKIVRHLMQLPSDDVEERAHMRCQLRSLGKYIS